jgi:hypothetical protein
VSRRCQPVRCARLVPDKPRSSSRTTICGAGQPHCGATAASGYWRLVLSGCRSTCGGGLGGGTPSPVGAGGRVGCGARRSSIGPLSRRNRGSCSCRWASALPRWRRWCCAWGVQVSPRWGNSEGVIADLRLPRRVQGSDHASQRAPAAWGKAPWPRARRRSTRQRRFGGAVS